MANQDKLSMCLDYILFSSLHDTTAGYKTIWTELVNQLLEYPM